MLILIIRLLIFGTGVLCGKFLETLNYEKCYIIAYVDNDVNRQNKVFNNKKVIAADKIVCCEYDFIVIANSHYIEINNQLLSLGISKNVIIPIYDPEYKEKNYENFCFNPNSCLKKIQKAFIESDNPSNALILGDSVMDAISYNDVVDIPFRKIIVNDLLNKYRICEISNAGYHSGIYFSIINLFKFYDIHPKIIIMPINIRSFSPQWDFNPRYRVIIV